MREIGVCVCMCVCVSDQFTVLCIDLGVCVINSASFGRKENTKTKRSRKMKIEKCYCLVLAFFDEKDNVSLEKVCA